MFNILIITDKSVLTTQCRLIPRINEYFEWRSPYINKPDHRFLINKVLHRPNELTFRRIAAMAADADSMLSFIMEHDVDVILMCSEVHGRLSVLGANK